MKITYLVKLVEKWVKRVAWGRLWVEVWPLPKAKGCRGRPKESKRALNVSRKRRSLALLVLLYERRTFLRGPPHSHNWCITVQILIHWAIVYSIRKGLESLEQHSWDLFLAFEFRVFSAWKVLLYFILRLQTSELQKLKRGEQFHQSV